MKPNRTCAECSTAFHAKKDSARFCSTGCRKTYNNRRLTRGALLYDAFMAMRYDRKAAQAAGVDWVLICRIGEMFHGEDMRDERKSFRPPGEVMAENASQINARVERIK